MDIIMPCPQCNGELVTIQPALWGCLNCDSLWTPQQLTQTIQGWKRYALEVDAALRAYQSYLERRLRIEYCEPELQAAYAKATEALGVEPR